jgi:hypothetical protein
MIEIRATAVIDNHQRSIIDKIEPFILPENLICSVTRGHSSPQGQLDTIIKYATQWKITYPEFKVGQAINVQAFVDGYGSIYWWQRVWSGLLQMFSDSNGKKGAKINPPISAICIANYVVDGVSKRGQVINPSPHIKALDDPKPCPIDFSGNIHDINDPKYVHTDLNQVVKYLTNAKNAGVGIRNITVEPANNCCHIDIS